MVRYSREPDDPNKGTYCVHALSPSPLLFVLPPVIVPIIITLASATLSLPTI